MLRIAIALALISFPTLQDPPPEPPRPGRQDGEELRKH